MPLSVPAILSNPHYLPHAIDSGGDKVSFLPTTISKLRRPAFIDGRSEFATGRPVSLPLDAILAAASEMRAPGPDRMIFHVSFCGSTLLARMLDVPGQSLVLREPNLLVDLAGWKKASGDVDGRFAPALAWARTALRRRWRASGPVLIKPSNWANNLLADIIADPGTLRPLFVTMERRPFLLAVLRGGRDRLAFIAQVAAHLADGTDGKAQLREAIAGTADPIGQAVNLAALALHLQTRMFSEAMRRGGWDGTNVLDASTLFSRPVEAALAANAILELGIDPAILANSAALAARENAKAPGRSFLPVLRESENDEVERYHGARIDAALLWAEQRLGPHPRLDLAGDDAIVAAG